MESSFLKALSVQMQKRPTCPPGASLRRFNFSTWMVSTPGMLRKARVRPCNKNFRLMKIKEWFDIPIYKSILHHYCYQNKLPLFHLVKLVLYEYGQGLPMWTPNTHAGYSRNLFSRSVMIKLRYQDFKENHFVHKHGPKFQLIIATFFCNN